MKEKFTSYSIKMRPNQILMKKWHLNKSLVQIKWSLISSKRQESIMKNLQGRWKATRNLKENSRTKTDQRRQRAHTIYLFNKLFLRLRHKIHLLVLLIWFELQQKCTTNWQMMRKFLIKESIWLIKKDLKEKDKLILGNTQKWITEWMLNKRQRTWMTSTCSFEMMKMIWMNLSL